MEHIAIKMEEGQDIVVWLKQNPFSLANSEEKLLIVQHGRPCPPLLNITSNVTDRSRSYTRHFTVANYDCYKWMCGSELLSKLFCWPCLLFAKGTTENVWFSTGFCNLKGLTKSAKAHENSKSHLQCIMDLYNFEKQRVDEGINKPLQINNSLHNEKVKKNRELLKYLIDVTCFLKKQKLPFHGLDETEQSLNKGNYMELLNLLKLNDPVLSEQLGSSTVFKGTCSDIQNDLVDSISDVVCETILKETENSDFVSIMFDEMADVKSRSQLSTVLRYVHKEEGCVKERFIGFTDVSADRSADALFAHVKNVVTNYKLEDKFVAQSYDGATVMSGHLSGLQKKVQEKYPKALFTHCYAHVLNLVLSQGMNDISECNTWFSTLNAISTFFVQSSKRTQAIQDHLKKSVPAFSSSRWCFTSSLVNAIKSFRKNLIEFFSNIYENDDGNWMGSDRCAAYGFIQFLENFDTVFLLNTFSPLFARTDVIFNLLQTEHVDIMACINLIQDFEQELKDNIKGFVQCDECKNKLGSIISEEVNCESCEVVGFTVVWEKTISMTDISSALRPTKKAYADSTSSLFAEQRYRKLFCKIVDNLLNHLTARFSSLKSLQFFELLNPSKFKSFSETNHFPDNLVADLQKIYPDLFDLRGLKNELQVFYRTAAFQTMSPCKLVSFLKAECLDSDFKEIFRLAKLICTIPATDALVNTSFSALKRIRAFKRGVEGEQISSVALLSIEKELLESIRQNEDFYTTIIQKFAAKTRRMDFMFK